MWAALRRRSKTSASNSTHNSSGSERKTVRDAWRHFQFHDLRDPTEDRSPTTMENHLKLPGLWGLCSGSIQNG